MHERKVQGRYVSLRWPQPHHFLWCVCTRVTCHCPHARPKAKLLCYPLWMHQTLLSGPQNRGEGNYRQEKSVLKSVWKKILFFLKDALSHDVLLKCFSMWNMTATYLTVNLQNLNNLCFKVTSKGNIGTKTNSRTWKMFFFLLPLLQTGRNIPRRSWHDTPDLKWIPTFRSYVTLWRALQNKLHCRQISELQPRFLCSSLRVRWRAVPPQFRALMVSVQGMRHRVPGWQGRAWSGTLVTAHHTSAPLNYSRE